MGPSGPQERGEGLQEERAGVMEVERFLETHARGFCLF